MFRQLMLAFLAAFLVVLASACAQVAGTQRSQLSLVSDSQLIPMAARQYQEILATAKISTDAKNSQMVKRVGARIKMAAEKYLSMFGRGGEIANYKWEFNLIDSKEANAFCLPGGKVAVYSGILPICQGEAGLATVMGHEVAHAIAHHGAERASQQALTNIGAQLLNVGLSSGGSSQVTAQAVMVAYGLGSQYGILLPYSRTHEMEADRIGLSLMAMAGYDPEEAIAFWTRMAKADKGRGPAEFLSTHPADQTRINNLEAFMNEAKSRYVPYGASNSSNSVKRGRASASKGQGDGRARQPSRRDGDRDYKRSPTAR